MSRLSTFTYFPKGTSPLIKDNIVKLIAIAQ